MDEISIKSFERRPSWLLHDINEMILQRNGKSLINEFNSTNNNYNHNYLKKITDKSHLYKNYQREIAPSTKTGEIYELKLKKSKVDVLNASNSEKKISNFVQKLREERQKQRIQHDAFMRNSLESPRNKPLTIERLTHIRPISAGRSPFSLTERTNSRPSTAPSKSSPNRSNSSSPTENQKKYSTINHNHNNNNSNTNTKSNRKLHNSSPTNRRSPELQHNINPVQTIPCKVTERICCLVKILQFIKNSKKLHFYIQVELRGKHKFAKKIQCWYRKAVLRRQAYHQAAMPSVFMHFLKNYQKKLAVKKIITFLREYSSIHSHAIVKRFLVCVRKSQLYIREMIRVKRARVYLITLYWEKIEKLYRKQIEDQERETFARLQRERMARITSGATCDIHGKWGMTHKQVVALFSHIDSVDIHRANILRETGSSSSLKSKLRTIQHSSTNPLLASASSILADTVDPVLRQKIIEKYVSYKRSLHLKRGITLIPVPNENSIQNNNDQHLHSSETQIHHSQFFTEDVSNIKLIKKFIQSNELNKELIERQLAHAGVAIEDDHELGRKRKVAMRVFRRKPFLCLTDQSLGKPWKQIIEEVVREDIIRKKRILQEQNRKHFQDRVNEDKKKGLPIPNFASSSERRETIYSNQLSILENSVNHEEDLFSPIGYSTSSPTTPSSNISLNPSTRRSTKIEKSFYPNQPISPSGESSQSPNVHFPVI